MATTKKIGEKRENSEGSKNMREIVAEIKSFKAKKMKIKEDLSEEKLKTKLCKEFDIDPRVTRVKREILDVNEKNFNEIKKEVEGINERDTGKCIDVYVLDYLWSRQLLLYGQKNFKKIRNSSVVIIGAGALGNELAKNLAFSGVGKLTIIDYDEIENSNLSKTVFFKESDIGKPKAQVITEKIKEMIPAVQFDFFDKMVEEINPLSFLEYDAIACCVDNYYARLYLSEISLKFGIPFFDTGVRYTRYDEGNDFDSNSLRIQNIFSADDPCFGCTVSHRQLQNLEEADATILHCTAPKVPSNITLMSMAASFQAEEILKYLSGTGNPIKYLYIDTDHNAFIKQNIKKNDSCFVCSGIKKVPVVKLKDIEEIKTQYGKFEIDYQKNEKYLVRVYNKETEKIDKEIIVEVSK